MNNSFSIDIQILVTLDILLDLAKNQKVDLTNIWVTKLSDQFLEFTSNKNLNLDLHLNLYSWQLG